MKRSCGSHDEMQTQLELATNLGYFQKESGQELMENDLEVARLINGLLKTLSTTPGAAQANSASSANSANPADYVS